MVVDLAAAFFSGACTKISDSGSSKYTQALGGLLAGALSYYLAVFRNIPEIVLGTLLGNVFAGKVDKQSHYLLVATTLSLYAIYGVPVAVMPFLLFIISAYLDEYFSEREDILGKRVLLPLAALLYAVVDYRPLVYIIVWDAGYRFTSYLIKRD